MVVFLKGEDSKDDEDGEDREDHVNATCCYMQE